MANRLIAGIVLAWLWVGRITYEILEIKKNGGTAPMQSIEYNDEEPDCE